MNRAQILEDNLGNGLTPFSDVANICRCSDSTVRRWAHGIEVPDADELERIFRSSLPLTFRKGLADSLFASSDLEVALRDKPCSRGNPMRLAIGGTCQMSELLQAIDQAMTDNVLDEQEEAECLGRIIAVEKKLKELKAALVSRQVRRVS